MFLFLHDMMYLLTAIGLTTGGSSTIHIYTQFMEQHNETEYTEQRIHKTKLRGLSPRANYTDRAAAAGRRS